MPILDDMIADIIRSDPSITLGLISPIAEDRRRAAKDLSATINDHMITWVRKSGSPEFFTLNDVKEAMFICRACASGDTLVRAMAAWIARTRKECRCDNLTR